MSLADHISRLGTAAVKSLRAFAILFLVLPLMVAAHQAFLPTVAFELLPKNGFTLRWFGVLFREEFLSAVGVSVLIAVVATAISLAGGTLAALALARSAFRGRELVNMIFLSPMMVPPVVKGLSFTLYFAIIGLRPGLVSLLVAHVVITLPYVVRVVYPCFYGLDRSLEEASRNLGATERPDVLAHHVPTDPARCLCRRDLQRHHVDRRRRGEHLPDDARHHERVGAAAYVGE